MPFGQHLDPAAVRGMPRSALIAGIAGLALLVAPPLATAQDRAQNLGGDKNPGTSEEAYWIEHGFDQYLDVGKDYRSDPGAKFSSGGQLQAALDRKMNSSDPVLIFPVYKTLGATGQNATYFVIGWVGFHLQSYDIHGNSASLTGYFVSYFAHGVLASSGSGGPPNYGVKSIQLIG